MQLIFLVETNPNNKSDFIYISKLINIKYKLNNNKISVIYLNGKGNYKKKNNEIKNLINRYKTIGESKVFVCLDTDCLTTNVNNLNFLNEVSNFCENYNYEHIWFNLNIEDVFLKKVVNNSDKKQAALKYKLNNNLNLYSNNIHQKQSSNICLILDKYL